VLFGARATFGGERLMGAPVTREHRARAMALLWSAECRAYPTEQRWIETGEGDVGPRLVAAAQNVADLEAEALYRGWLEGRQAGFSNARASDCPYPPPANPKKVCEHGGGTLGVCVFTLEVHEKAKPCNCCDACRSECADAI